MAAAGVPRSSVTGSDEFYTFTCTPCFRKGRTTGAEVYCVQCEEHLCKICVDNHNSFAKMAAHTLQDRDQMDAKGTQRVQPLLTVPCEQHPGQVYSLYCSHHNKVCCPVCSPIHHKLCVVVYIPDVLNEGRLGTELAEFRCAAMNAHENLVKLLEKRGKDMEYLTDEKDREVDKIRHTIEVMIAGLRSLEQSAIDDVTIKYNKFKSSIESDLTYMKSALNALDGELDKLEKANDETTQFVHMKNALEIKSCGKELVEDIQAHRGNEGLIYMIDKQVEETMRKLQSLGKLVVDYNYSVTLEGIYRVNTEPCGQVCGIGDVCLTEDDSILIADWNNRCLKRFDERFRFIDHLELERGPEGVCSVSEEQAAVTIGDVKTVKIVTLDASMAVCKSFKTEDNCRGIYCHNKHLYILCGGGIQDNEGPGHIAVYSSSGTFVRNIETDSKGRLFSSTPLDIAVRSAYDNVILVCDDNNGLVAIGEDGERLWTVTCKDLELESVNAISVDTHGQMVVSDYKSNKVVLVSRNGRKLSELFTARDGINKRGGLCIDARRSRLIVGTENKNHIVVCKLT